MSVIPLYAKWEQKIRKNILFRGTTDMKINENFDWMPMRLFIEHI